MADSAKTVMILAYALCLPCLSMALTVEERTEILDVHNSRRGSEGASNMQRLDYDVNLEQAAQKWADQCEFNHASSFAKNWPDCANNACGQPFGENLYIKIGGGPPAWTNVIDAWWNEKKDFTYPNTCASGKVCGHYTAVVWAKTRKVGCGKYAAGCTCTSKHDDCKSGMMLYVCQYDPPGNLQGAAPFAQGPVCSSCNVGTTCCEEGLCVGQPPASELTSGTVEHDGSCNGNTQTFNLGECYQSGLPGSPFKIVMALKNNEYKPGYKWCQNSNDCTSCPYTVAEGDGKCAEYYGINMKFTYTGSIPLPTAPGTLPSVKKGACATGEQAPTASTTNGPNKNTTGGGKFSNSTTKKTYTTSVTAEMSCDNAEKVIKSGATGKEAFEKALKKAIPDATISKTELKKVGCRRLSDGFRRLAKTGLQADFTYTSTQSAKPDGNTFLTAVNEDLKNKTLPEATSATSTAPVEQEGPTVSTTTGKQGPTCSNTTGSQAVFPLLAALLVALSGET
eukprot:CAMPEP_0172790090 /NCGR_PEP_ID=MMETSP1074-20121228/207787_1 /TAXON_ID=2916 /ORGANISM="Ceratium fusus, Strain PA161109" /LENGTH=507 /DNA_ID=CAMNT_0013627133 /DNA_START=15 /DNA_END=1535 /DNA_ORIENTATION=+